MTLDKERIEDELRKQKLLSSELAAIGENVAYISRELLSDINKLLQKLQPPKKRRFIVVCKAHTSAASDDYLWTVDVNAGNMVSACLMHPLNASRGSDDIGCIARAFEQWNITKESTRMEIVEACAKSNLRLDVIEV